MEKVIVYCPIDGTQVELRHSPKWGDKACYGNCPTCHGRLTKRSRPLGGGQYVTLIEHVPWPEGRVYGQKEENT